MDGEAGWWTTSGNIGLFPLARVMGVGSQQQHEESDEGGDGEGVLFCDGVCGEDGDIRCKRGDDGWAGEDPVGRKDTADCIQENIGDL